MKVSTIAYLGMAATASALESLTEYTNDIPSCAVSALRDAMKTEGCDLSSIDGKDFDCLCKHSAAIITIVVPKISTVCTADFSQAIGGICGLWDIYSTTASDYAQATKALGDKLGGSGGGSAPTPTAGAGNAPSGNSAAASPSSTKNAAVAPTVGAAMGIIGGAAAMAALL